MHSYGATMNFGGAMSRVTRISGPAIEWSSVDKTHLASTDRFREFAPGLGDGGQVEFECHFVKAQIATLYSGGGATAAGVVTFPTDTGESAGSRFNFTGFVTKISPEVEEDAEVSVMVGIKITGKPTFTQGS